MDCSSACFAALFFYGKAKRTSETALHLFKEWMVGEQQPYLHLWSCRRGLLFVWLDAQGCFGCVCVCVLSQSEKLTDSAVSQTLKLHDLEMDGLISDSDMPFQLILQLSLSFDLYLHHMLWQLFCLVLKSFFAHLSTRSVDTLHFLHWEVYCCFGSQTLNCPFWNCQCAWTLHLPIKLRFRDCLGNCLLIFHLCQQNC